MAVLCGFVNCMALWEVLGNTGYLLLGGTGELTPPMQSEKD